MFVKGMYFYIVVFSKSMLCKYFHVRSNLSFISFEYFVWEKLFMLKEIKYQKVISNVPAGSLGFSTLILYMRCLELIASDLERVRVREQL